MKLNLPTTWTSQKMSALFLLTLLHSTKIKAGQQFYQCLGTDQYQDSDQYTTITNFANNIADKEVFCCNSGSGPWVCATLSPTCPYPTHIQGQCVKVGQSKFCIMQGLNWGTLTINLPGNLCGGVLGNSLPSNVTIGTCPNLSVVSDSLIKTSTTPGFSWLCCDANACNVPINVAVNGMLAFTNCPTSQYSMMCFQDNGGWSCTGNLSPNFNDISQPIGSCVLQIEPSTKVRPSGISSLSSTKLYSSPTISSNNVNNNDSNGNQSGTNFPTVIIAIAVPTGVLLIATTAGVLYYRHQLNKSREQIRIREQGNNISLQPISIQPQYQTLATQEEQPYQAQVQVNPYLLQNNRQEFYSKS